MHDFVIYTTDHMPQRGDSPAPSADAPTSTICTRYNGVAPPGLVPSIQCDTRVYGRYVVIQIPGPSETLVLCEMQIYGKLTPRTYLSKQLAITVQNSDAIELLSLPVGVFADEPCGPLPIIAQATPIGYSRYQCVEGLYVPTTGSTVSYTTCATHVTSSTYPVSFTWKLSTQICMGN